MNKPIEITPLSSSVEAEEYQHRCWKCGGINYVKVHYFRSLEFTNGAKKLVPYNDELLKEFAQTINQQSKTIGELLDENRLIKMENARLRYAHNF